MSAVLSTDKLTKAFNGKAVVDRVTFSVAGGAAFGILGRNGAGKSTLVKMLTTLLPPTSGTAVVGGYDLVTQAPKVRGVIGYVPQALSPDAELTARENLQIMAVLYDIPRAQRAEHINFVLELMGLTDTSDKLVRTYSGGMIRRLEIGQSMLHRPQVLFMDEPSVGLDPVAREALWEHIEQLRAQLSITICITTHYMDEAAHLCSRFAILRHGKAVALGTLDELRAASGRRAASLDELFAYFTEDEPQSPGGYRDTVSARRGAR